MLVSDAAPHFCDIDDQAARIPRRVQYGFDGFRESPAKSRVTGNRARAGQRHMLPSPGGFALIARKSIELRGDWPGLTRRPQTHIDVIEPPLGGRSGDCSD